mmetsp:Transcript_24837/g.51227  ORF Transcript_24837/g.51227 Transcript_24837/m.51227 type:complete len:287 (-) Transcript_24837:157-1017(-)
MTRLLRRWLWLCVLWLLWLLLVSLSTSLTVTLTVTLIGALPSAAPNRQTPVIAGGPRFIDGIIHGSASRIPHATVVHAVVGAVSHSHGFGFERGMTVKHGYLSVASTFGHAGSRRRWLLLLWTLLLVLWTLLVLLLLPPVLRRPSTVLLVPRARHRPHDQRRVLSPPPIRFERHVRRPSQTSQLPRDGTEAATAASGTCRGDGTAGGRGRLGGVGGGAATPIPRAGAYARGDHVVAVVAVAGIGWAVFEGWLSHHQCRILVIGMEIVVMELVAIATVVVLWLWLWL